MEDSLLKSGTLNGIPDAVKHAQEAVSTADSSGDDATSEQPERDCPITKSDSSQRKVIEAGRGWTRLRFDELWDSRELIWMFAWRDIAVRYKQTLVGIVWAILQPAIMVILFSVVFRRWAHMPSQGVSYPLFAFAGFLIWNYFSAAVASSSGSVIRSSHILSKVYFPRLAIPIAGVLPPLVDFAIGFTAFVGLLLFNGFMPNERWLLIPPLVALTMLLALGVGVWMAALGVEFRDFSHILPFAMQLWMFASPIVYPPDLVSWRWRTAYTLNPMAGIIDTFRWVLLGTNSGLDCNIMLATAVTLVLLVTGILYFQYQERTFADLI